MWLIDAQLLTVETDSNGGIWRGTRQIPTFFLDERVQGIVDAEHAKTIALQILDPMDEHLFKVHAEKVV